MKSLINRRFSPKRQNKPASSIPVTKHSSPTKPRVKPQPKHYSKPSPRVLGSPNETQSNSSETQNSLPIKSILKQNDAAPGESKSVRIVDNSLHDESRRISTPTRPPTVADPSSLLEIPPVPLDSMGYSASDLEKGQLVGPSETTPLLDPLNGNSYQNQGSIEEEIYLAPSPEHSAEIDCWAPHSAPPSSERPHTPATSLQSQLPMDTPMARFLRALYEKYPVIITYVLIVICIAGAIFSLVTGRGSTYLWVIIKASLCWILGTDVAKMLFGEQFCDIALKAS